MHKVADKMVAMKPVLAEGLTREMGKPYKESADEVDWSAHSIGIVQKSVVVILAELWALQLKDNFTIR